MKKLILSLLLALPAGWASAATLDFSGNICGGGTSCSNGETIDQSYGDIAGQVDVQYDSDRATPVLTNVLYWGPNYETLAGVAYGNLSGGGLSISFLAGAGYDAMLTSFDIAPYANRVRNTLVQIIDLATNSLLVNDTYNPLSTAGITSYSGSWSSSVGLQINLGPDAWDVGIDNIVYSAKVSGPSPIPLPAAGFLLIGALGGLGLMRRRKKS